MIKQDIYNTIEFLSNMAANATLKEQVNFSVAMDSSELSEEELQIPRAVNQ